jgi:hemoglobin-like flavoprotein
MTKYMETFFAKFFEMSPTSKRKFRDMATQKAALWGSLYTVPKLLDKPEKMRKLLLDTAKTHKSRGIVHKELMLWVRALRAGFRAELGNEYTEQMDAVWKQFLELIVLFLVDKDDETGKGERLSTKYDDLDPDSKREDSNSHKSSKQDSAVANIYGAIANIQPSDGSRFHEHSQNSESGESSTNHSQSAAQEEPDYSLDLVFFRQRMPAGVPDSAILAEVQKLNDQLIYSTKQLATFTLKEVEQFVLPGAAKALTPFLAK